MTPLSTRKGRTAPERKPVGIWVRVSSEEQAQGESPRHHETRARMYAESREWAVVRVYDLSGVSGKSVKDHPECKKMLADVAEGRIGALIFSKLARFARNTRELLDFAEYFEVHRADLVSLDESIDTSTPAGRFFYTLIAAMAQWEREETAERVKASVKVRAKLGKPLGGVSPFGYRWEGGTLVLDPNEAPVRALMFELFEHHHRVKTVARELNDRGYRTRRGKPFSDSAVYLCLTDPLSKGQRRANYTRSLGRDKRWERKPEEEWVYVEAPAVVSEEVWERVNTVLAGRKDKWQPGRKARYLFSGLLYCRCGEKMYKPNNMRKYYCRACRNKMPEEDLERVFVEQLRGFFLDPEEITARLEENDRVIAEKRALLASLTGQRVSTERKMDQVYELYLDGQITPEGFGERYRPLEDRLAALSDEIPRLQGQIDALVMDLRTTEVVVGEAQTLYSAWETLTFDEKRAVLETIVERITVGDSTVEIDLAYVPSTPRTRPFRARERAPAPLEAVGKRLCNRTGTTTSRPWTRSWRSMKVWRR